VVLVSGVFIAISVRHVPIFVTVAGPSSRSNWNGVVADCVNGASKKSALGILNQMGLDLIPSFQRTSLWERSPWPALVLIDRPIRGPRFSGRDIPDGAGACARSGKILPLARADPNGPVGRLSDLPASEQKVFVDAAVISTRPAIGNQFLHVMAARRIGSR